MLWCAVYPAQATKIPIITTVVADHEWLPRVEGTPTQRRATEATVIHRAELLKGPRNYDYSSGHGGARQSMSPKLFLLFEKVSRYSHFKSFSGDDRFVVVLPCPKVFLETCSECCKSVLLLLAGDIEENPGPDFKAMFNQLLLGQKK